MKFHNCKRNSITQVKANCTCEKETISRYAIEWYVDIHRKRLKSSLFCDYYNVDLVWRRENCTNNPNVIHHLLMCNGTPSPLTIRIYLIVSSLLIPSLPLLLFPFCFFPSLLLYYHAYFLLPNNSTQLHSIQFFRF